MDSCFDLDVFAEHAQSTLAGNQVSASGAPGLKTRQNNRVIW